VSILGVDTSSAAVSACVLRADGEAFEVAPDPVRAGRPPAHAQELMPAIADVMERAGLQWGHLAAIAVGVGPGAFTGLRIGLATARALAGANGLPLRGVSSLAALAEGIESHTRLPVIDAKRGEVFAALYEDGKELWPPFAARPEAVAERVREEAAARAQRSSFVPSAAGDGSVRFRQVLESAGIRVAPEGSGAHAVRALHVCRLAAEAPDELPATIVPEYLRAPDARPL